MSAWGRIDCLQHLQLLFQILFKLGEAIQQPLNGWLLAGWLTIIREKLLNPALRIKHVELRVAEGAIIESVGKAGVQIDETTNLLRMTASDRTQLFASHRVSSEHRLLQIESLNHGKYIVTETVGRIIVVIGSGYAGIAEPATCDAVDVVFCGELGRKGVEDMRRIAQTGEEHKWSSGASPVKDFELDAGFDRDELHAVVCGIDRPGSRLGGALKVERKPRALNPGAGDRVTVCTELAFVGGLRKLEHKLCLRILHSNGTRPISIC